MTHKQLLTKVKKLSRREQLAFLRALLAYLGMLGLLKKSMAMPSARSSRKHGVKAAKKKRRMSPKQKAALRKAIHANHHMKPAAKRKALAKLK